MFKLILTLALVYSVSARCPRIIPRGGWNARESVRNLPTLAIRPSPFVIIHPTGTRSCTTQGDCSSVIRDIQDFQIQVNGWPDISYHFIIGSDARIYQGRGWGRQGVNVPPFDNQAINIGIVGRFTGNDQITTEQAAALESLINCGISERSLDNDVGVIAQCQTALGITACEQNNVFSFVSEHSRFVEQPRPI